MKRFTDYQTLGAKDVVLLVEELHTRGYQQLRFFGYVSPNGLAYRVHIAHRDAMSENGYELQGTAIWYSSVGSDCCGVSVDTLADEFLQEFGDHPDLLKAKAGDPEYVKWFGRVVELARKDVFLYPYEEYSVSSIYKGYLDTIGGEHSIHLPFPPTPPRPFTGSHAAHVWVECASQVAKRLHQGQVDKAGEPYFEGHLSTVAAQGRDWRERVVGYLHDSTEDTNCSLDDLLSLLEEGAGAQLPYWDRVEIELALRLLDHHSAESREAYIQGITVSKVATAVKLHDLTHNMDLSRIPSPSPKDYERLERYKREFAFLSDYLYSPAYLD